MAKQCAKAMAMGESNFKLALITGASAGIGAAVAKLLARKGVKVVLVARRKEKLAEVLSSIEEEGGSGWIIPCDVGAKEGILSMAKQVKEEIGLPDIVVNNAGSYYMQDFCDCDYSSWERMVNMNILGYLFTIGEFLPAMKERGSGHIVNISSDSERAAFPGFTVYSGTKFFWAGASDALRRELTGTGVRLTNILPGYVWTEGLQWMLSDERSRANFTKFGLGDPDEIISQRDKMLKPEDVAVSVWESVDKPANVHVNDILIRDAIQ